MDEVSDRVDFLKIKNDIEGIRWRVEWMFSIGVYFIFKYLAN